ncbi:hypothetical protein Ciccas_010535 [Cichlidogyrus casuarinus]|uniref:C2H2-type domain-containing protein n=1 Tax=Cichlidogyrus casuarinus TaxID=1844966 RepID=A0ABD2PTU1_9PLAT
MSSTIFELDDTELSIISQNTDSCPLCDFVWCNSDDCYRHIEDCHDESLVAVCKTCNQLFSTEEVKVHLLRCKGTHICHVCRATFAQPTYLQRHIKRKHSHATERPICELCNRSFSSIQALVIHKRLHTGEMPYSCHMCDMRFNQPRHLQQHVESRHSGTAERKPKPFKCGKCDRSFQLKSSYVHHMKQYHTTPENACQCRLCDKIFPYLSDLKRHLTSHLPKEAGMYSCEICSKTFKQKRLLTAHLQVHQNPDFFSCAYCNRCYATKSYLDNHISSKHALQVEKRPRCSLDEEELSSDDYLLDFGDEKSLLDIFWNSSPNIADDQLLDANVKILKNCLFGDKANESSDAVQSILIAQSDDYADAMSVEGDEPPTIESRIIRPSDDSLEVDFLSESSR